MEPRRPGCLTFSHRPVSESERVGGDNMIYKPLGENVPDMVYLGSLASFDLAYAWAQDKCVPLVREITFENGEVGSRRGRGAAGPPPGLICPCFSRN